MVERPKSTSEGVGLVPTRYVSHEASDGSFGIIVPDDESGIVGSEPSDESVETPLRYRDRQKGKVPADFKIPTLKWEHTCGQYKVGAHGRHRKGFNDQIR